MKRGLRIVMGIVVLVAMMFFSGVIVDDRAWADGDGGKQPQNKSRVGSTLPNAKVVDALKKKYVETIVNTVSAKYDFYTPQNANDIMSSITISTNTTLTSNKTYSTSLVINPNVTYNMNHKTVIVNGNLTIKGRLDANGGILKVYGDLIIQDGFLDIDGGSVTVYKSSSSSDDGNFINVGGQLSMQSSIDKITIANGDFIAAGDDSSSYLRAGKIDISGDFIQLAMDSYASFAPESGLTVIIRGASSTPRTILFETPATSYFVNYAFASGTVVAPGSCIAIKKTLTANTVITIPNAVIYFTGNLNGKVLTANCDTFVIAPGGTITFYGGTIIANCDAGFGEESYVMMNSSLDAFIAYKDFYAASNLANLESGLLDIQGDFYQLGTSYELAGDTFAPKQGFRTRFNKSNTYVEFDNPGFSYFTILETADGASFASSSQIAINLDLTGNVIDQPWKYPNLVYSGNLNGKTLTINCDFTIGVRGINVNAGKLLAKHNVTCQGKLIMKNPSDLVIVDGNYQITRDCYYQGDPGLTAGELHLKGDFIISTNGNNNGLVAFNAEINHKTLFEGTSQRVVFVAPAFNYFRKLEVASGTSFTSDSVLSVRDFLSNDLTIDAPNVYFSGGVNGHVLNITGNLKLVNLLDISFGKGRMNIGNDFIINGGRFSMSNAEDTIYVKGDFVAAGHDFSFTTPPGPLLTNGKLYVEGDFTQSNASSSRSFVAASPHMTILCGTGPQAVHFTSASPTASKFGVLYLANAQVDYNPDEICYDSLIQSGTDLSSIEIDEGVLKPVFMPYCLKYIAVTPKGTSHASIHCAKYYDNSTMTIDNIEVDNKEITDIPYSSYKEVSIQVSALNNVCTKIYKVRFEQLNTDLSGIGISSGSLNTPFNPETLSYSVDLPASVQSISIAPITSNPDSTFTIDGAKVSSNNYTLKPGETKSAISIVVTGQDGSSTKEYTLSIHRAPLIDSIAVVGGVLSPAFDYSVDQYEITLPIENNSIIITPTKAADCDTITFNGIEQNSYSADLRPGEIKSVDVLAKAKDSTVTHQYAIIVSRAALVSGLNQSYGTFSQPFKPDVYEYTLTVPSSYSADIILTPVTTTDCASLQFKENGSDIGTDTLATISMAVGQSRTIEIVARSSGSVSVTYVIHVTRTAIVSDIKMNVGTLNPAFEPGVFNYTVEYPAGTGELTVIPTIASGSVAVDGKPYFNPPTYYVRLDPGYSHTFIIAGTSGSVELTYRVTVKVQKPLSDISLSMGKFTVAFNAAVLNYTVRIPASSSEVLVSPDMTSECTKLLINNIESNDISLTDGQSAVIQATGLDGKTVTTYTVTVNRIAMLAGITTSAGALTPAFDAATGHYAVYVSGTVTSVRITPAKTASCTAMRINGSNVSYITLSPAAGGKSTATIDCTNGTGAQAVTQRYIVDVYRIAPITGITITGGKLAPTFSTATTVYTVSVPATTSAVTVKPVMTASYKAGTLTINGSAVSYVTLRPAVGGSLQAKIRAQAVNGVWYAYTVTVKRAALLTGVRVSPGTLSPAFKPTVLAYSVVRVPATATQVKITPVKASTGVKSVTINGRVASYAYIKPPVGGSANCTIVATASDGRTKVTYTIKVTRDPLISAIRTSVGALTPAFSPTRTAYTINVPATASSVTITPVKTAYTKTLMIDNRVQSYKRVSPPLGGSVTCTIVATATDGRTKSTYTVRVVRHRPITGITVADGSDPTKLFTLSPAFSPTTLEYNVTVPGGTPQVTITPAKASGYSFSVNGGLANMPGTVTVPPGGTTTAYIVATYPGGSILYKVNVHREDLLTGITVSAGSLNPSFSAAVAEYEVLLDADTASTRITPVVSGCQFAINGDEVEYLDVTLEPGGEQVVTIVVTTSVPGEELTYTVTVRRAGP